jgi:DNA-binding SARP family transcriptional activator/TolB-like protein
VLLAILATAGTGGVSRDRIALLLWSESDADRARHALAQLVYLLRQSLPADAVVGSTTELRLGPAVIASDVAEFDQAVATGDHERAARLYTGPFLDGVHLSDAPEFERWVDAERARRASEAAGALEALALGAGARGDHREAVRWARRRAEFDPLDAAGAVLLMRSLEAAGNRSGALQHASVHERLVIDHLGVRPDEGLRQLAAELRARSTEAPAPEVAPARVPAEATAAIASVAAAAPAAASEARWAEPPLDGAISPPVGAHDGRPSPPPRGRAWRVLVPVAAALLVAVASLTLAARPRAGTLPPVHERTRAAVAVLPFEVRGAPAYSYLGEGLVDLLSAGLDGAGELRAVDPKALLAYTARQRTRGADPQAGREAAERFGARWFVLGSVVEMGGRLRITATLYGREPATSAGSAVPPPVSVAQTTVEGPATQLFALVDRLAAALLADVHRGPRDRLMRTAALTSPSLEVLKAYLAGERHYRAGRYGDAMEAFGRATAGDSTFALAHYRRAVAAEWAGDLDAELDAAERSARLAGRLSEHDRLLLQAFRARRRGAAGEAERLYRAVVAGYPDDVEAWHQLGEVLFHNNAYRGRSFTESRRVWERVLTLEPGDWQALVHLARIAAREGRSAELDALVARATPLMPPAERQELQAFRAFAAGTPAERERAVAALRAADDAVVWQSLWRVAVYTQDLPGAEQIARLLTDPGRATGAQRIGHETLMLLRLAQGRVRAAAAEGARVGRPEPWSTQVGNPYFLALGFVPVDRAATAALRDRYATWDSVAVAATIRLTVSGRDVQPLRRAFVSGLLEVRLRDFAAADHGARALHAVRGAQPVEALARLLAATLRADALRAADRPADALAVLERAPDEVPTELAGALGVGPYSAWLRAEVLRALGRDEEALAWYASRTDLFVGELIYLAPASLRAGEIHERRGEYARAVSSYRRFLGLWAGADVELRPLVEATARRVERLCTDVPAAACGRGAP